MTFFTRYFKLGLYFLLLFELSRLYFVIYNAPLFQDKLLFTFIEAALKGLMLDLSTVAYCCSPFFLIWIMEIALKRQCPKWIAGTILGIETLAIFLVTIADAELFIQWGNKFSNQVLVYITHPREMALSAGSTNWLRTGILGILTLSLFIFLFKKMLKSLASAKELHYRQLGGVFVLLAFNFVMVRGGLGVATISQSSAIYSQHNVNNAAGINSLWNALYYIFNDVSSIYGKNYRVTDEKTAETEFREQIGPYDDSFTLTDAKRPNFLVVMLESFTASASKALSGYNDCLPNLDRIAAENASFAKCYASGDRTEKGLVAVLSGYPAQPASSIIVFPDKVSRLPGLGKVLSKQGYQNIFIYGGDAEFASMKSYLLVNDFNKIVDKTDFSSTALTSKWGAHDEHLYARALDALGAQKQPFLATILTLSSHEPFDVPYKSTDLPKDKWYGFRNSLRYADQCLYDFLEKCKRQPWYANTVIILVADHGHDIGLENIFYFGKEKYHIPLVVTGGALKPGIKGKQFNGVVSQTIIPSLILNSLRMDSRDFQWQTGAENPHGFAQYHYTNGFGRITNYSECVSDNLSGSYYFRGRSADSAMIRHDGQIFQQVLIDDFLRK